MSDPTISDNYLKNKMAYIWTTIKGHQKKMTENFNWPKISKICEIKPYSHTKILLIFHFD